MKNQQIEYKDVINDARKCLWVQPPSNYVDTVLEEFFIILKQNNLKMKKLQIGENYIFYSKTKCINFQNAMIEIIKNPLVIQKGIRISKQGKQIEIFGEIDQLYEYMKKFCYQIGFEKIFEFCVIYCEKGKIKVGRVRNKYTNEEKISKVYEGMIGETDTIYKELTTLRLLKHKNLIQLKEVFKSNQQIFLIFDYLEGGSLAEKIKNKLTEEEIRVILKNILEGLNFLHELSIFHRDLKPENIMFSNKNDNESLQIIDFTLADFWNQEHKYQFRRCGTPGYVAPEVLQDKRYGLNVDIFSLGIILFEMLTCKNPFIHKQNYEDIVTANYNGNIDLSDVKCSNECMDLLTKCLKVDQHKRISSREALKHPFILGNIKPVDQKNTFRIRSFDKLQNQLSTFSQQRILHLGTIDNSKITKNTVRSLHTESPADSTSDSPSTPNSSRTERKVCHLRTIKSNQWNSFKVSKFKK